MNDSLFTQKQKVRADILLHCGIWHMQTFSSSIASFADKTYL